jgi:hypothetical protein
MEQFKGLSAVDALRREIVLIGSTMNLSSYSVRFRRVYAVVTLNLKTRESGARLQHTYEPFLQYHPPRSRRNNVFLFIQKASLLTANILVWIFNY